MHNHRASAVCVLHHKNLPNEFLTRGEPPRSRLTVSLPPFLSDSLSFLVTCIVSRLCQTFLVSIKFFSTFYIVCKEPYNPFLYGV